MPEPGDLRLAEPGVLRQPDQHAAIGLIVEHPGQPDRITTGLAQDLDDLVFLVEQPLGTGPDKRQAALGVVLIVLATVIVSLIW